MSTLQNNQNIWSIRSDNANSKYEKCRNITEEIYKRINITFQIKKLEGTQSDVSENSDQIDSNELSNETDLFACDKSDSISSSTETEKPSGSCEKYINNNNNEEVKKKVAVVYKRPKKRFRKRIKKRQSKTADSDGSSDEAPLSRIVDTPKVKTSQTLNPMMGVPKVVIVTKDLRPAQVFVKQTDGHAGSDKQTPPLDFSHKREERESEKMAAEWRSCHMCSLSFRGERGLRRHLSISHVSGPMLRSNDEQRHNLT